MKRVTHRIERVGTRSRKQATLRHCINFANCTKGLNVPKEFDQTCMTFCSTLQLVETLPSPADVGKQVILTTFSPVS